MSAHRRFATHDSQRREDGVVSRLLADRGFSGTRQSAATLAPPDSPFDDDPFGPDPFEVDPDMDDPDAGPPDEGYDYLVASPRGTT